MKVDDKIWTNRRKQHLAKALSEIELTCASQALRDLFSIGCYLLLEGKEEAGTKTCKTALDAMQFHRTGREIIWQGLRHGKARLLAELFRPHCEIKSLIDRSAGEK